MKRAESLVGLEPLSVHGQLVGRCGGAVGRKWVRCPGTASRRGRIVAHYYDIESGTRSYAAQGPGGLAGFDIPIPRDGGLQDLLADAAKRPARLDRVIVASISRLSRDSSVVFRVEDELRSAGVRLCATDEPLEESFGTIVLRHVNIGIAPGYHHELMVKSRQSQESSTRQGSHTGGVALYGYRFVTHDHPSPHKASRGINKRTLELDPVRALVVRTIFPGSTDAFAADVPSQRALRLVPLFRAPKRVVS